MPIRRDDDGDMRDLYDAARGLGVNERIARDFADGKSDGREFADDVSRRIHEIDNGKWQYEDMDRIERYNREYDDMRKKLDDDRYYDMKALDAAREDAQRAYDRMEAERYPRPEYGDY